MKHLLSTLLAIAASVLCTSAQTDNPRGVYKMTFMVDKNGTKIQTPYEQYKVCTDSVTLTATINGNNFRIINNDAKVLNYTGEGPNMNDATATRIFNSNDKHFTLKWWSNMKGHLFYPQNDWCTEYYESDTYSSQGKILFDALQSKAPAIDNKCPLYGHWHRINIYDELPDVKAAIKKIVKNKEEFQYSGYDILILTPSHFIYTGGQILNSNTDGKSFIEVDGLTGTNTFKVYRLSKDYIAVAKKRNQFTDYELWKRITDDVTPLNRIASKCKKRFRL